MPRHSMSTFDKILFANQAAQLSDDEWSEIHQARQRIREKRVRVKKPAPKKPRPDPQP